MTAKILVVDDSITIQKIVSMAFEKEDALVEGIGNGSDALVKLKNFKPDIVLADVNMPGLNGLELSKKIKNSSEFNSVSVLLLTSDFEDFDENLFRDSLADDHITKPFKSEDIVHRVKELLDASGSADTVENDENVIALSPTDQMEIEEESVLELEKDQLMAATENTPFNEGEDTSLEEEEVQLELSDKDMLVQSPLPENNELVVEPGEDAAVDTASGDDQNSVEADSSKADSPENSSSPAVKKVPEESLEELVRRVTELSRKSATLREQSPVEDVQPLETLDEMIKEVNALKKGSPPLNNGDGNGAGKTVSPPDSPEVNTVIAELNYLSEENADELEAAFNEILRENKNFSPSICPEPSEDVVAANETDEENKSISEPDRVPEDFVSHPFATSPANSLEDFEIDASLQASEENSPQEETLGVTAEENLENISALQSSKEELLSQLMGKDFREALEQSLTASMEKEISKISEKITKSVEDAVKKIIPGLVQETIAKEIDSIKNEKNR